MVRILKNWKPSTNVLKYSTRGSLEDTIKRILEENGVTIANSKNVFTQIQRVLGKQEENGAISLTIPSAREESESILRLPFQSEGDGIVLPHAPFDFK